MDAPVAVTASTRPPEVTSVPFFSCVPREKQSRPKRRLIPKSLFLFHNLQDSLPPPSPPLRLFAHGVLFFSNEAPRSRPRQATPPNRFPAASSPTAFRGRPSAH